jgi:hypothetical protein
MAITTQVQSANPADWAIFYRNLQEQGNVPNYEHEVIGSQTIFRNMYLDLSVVKQTISKSGINPLVTTLYTDVLVIPDDTNWLLDSSGLVIFARRIEVGSNCSIMLDFRKSTTARLVIFADETTGIWEVKAITQDPQPVQFAISALNVSPGLTVSYGQKPELTILSLAQGIAFQIPEDMPVYLGNSFIYGSLIYDQYSDLALSLFTWVKNWASQSPDFAELFYRSTNLVTLLNAQINAQANGAVFVPYLTSSVYTTLAQAFAASAAKYENDYIQLSTQKVLTEQGISLAKTLVANAQSEIEYILALQTQAEGNYDNAVSAARIANTNFERQQIAVQMVAADFEQIGLPDYERAEIIKAVFELATAVVTFAAAIAAMALGQGEAAPAAAASAIGGAKAVASAAGTGAEVAKTANNLADTMAKLKKLVEVLKKVYELAKAVKEVASNIQHAEAEMETIQKMDAATDGADLSASSGWALFKLQTDAVLQQPVEKGIGFAEQYKMELDKLVIYGQALSAAQLAVVTASQQSAAIAFKLYYAKEKQAQLQQYVDSLKVGEAPILNMMQQFYQRYTDSKSSLFSALKSYQASYFYWALRNSSIQPKIIDSVSDMNAGIQNITQITMDQTSAMSQFDPAPQEMENTVFTITDSKVLKSLSESGKTTWTLPIDSQEFAGLSRVRLSTVRIWLEGIKPATGNSVFINISTSGNYLDRFKGTNYQFVSKPLNRAFKYSMLKPGEGQGNPSWKFNNGDLGYVQIDGKVDHEVSYAYFLPTPFSEWSISLQDNNPGIDYSGITSITMYFEGSAIGSTLANRVVLKAVETEEII